MIPAFSKQERQSIPVADAETAVEIAQLIEEISSAPNRIQCLKSNTRDYTVFDYRIYRSFAKDRLNWQYKAERGNGAWIVPVAYVGLPASIMEPPVHEIIMTEENKYRETRLKDGP